MIIRILCVFTLSTLTAWGAPTSLTLQNCNVLNAQLIAAASKSDKKKVVRVIGLRDSSLDGKVEITKKEMDALLRTIGKLEDQTVVGHAIDRFTGVESPKRTLPLNAEEEGKRLQRVRNTITGVKVGTGILALGLGLWFFGPAAYDFVAPIWEDEDETLFRRNSKLLAKKYNLEIEDDLYDSIDRISSTDRGQFRATMRELHTFLAQEASNQKSDSENYPTKLKKIKFDKSYGSIYKESADFETDDEGNLVAELNQFTTIEDYKKLLTSDWGGIPNLFLETKSVETYLQDVIQDKVSNFRWVWSYPKHADLSPEDAAHLKRTTVTLLGLFEGDPPTFNFEIISFRNQDEQSYISNDVLYLNYREAPSKWLHFFGVSAENDK